MKEEIIPQSEIVSQINELHAKAESLVKSAKENASEAIAYAVECGKYLHAQKKSLPHGSWIAWIGENCNFCRKSATNYINLYRKFSPKLLESSNGKHVSHLSEVAPKTLRQAYIATGILLDIPKSENGEKITPLVVHVKHIDAVVLWYRKTAERTPAKNWNYIEREALINDLTPLMEIYNELIELQEASE